MAAPLRSATDRWVVAGIAITFALVLLVLYSGWDFIEQRSVSLVEEALDRDIEAAEMRVEAWATGWATVMNTESVFLQREGKVGTMELARRWRALLEANWPVVDVRVADAQGNETAVIRSDSMMLLQEAPGDRDGGLPFFTRIDGALPGDPPRTWIGDAHEDPREQAWYGRALQNERVEPIWTGPGEHDDRMHLSRLLRSNDEGSPYRILTITIDPARSGTKLIGRGAGGMSLAFVRLPSGAIIEQSPTGVKDRATLIDQVAEAYLERHATASFAVDDGAWRARIAVHALNGTSLAIGAIVSVKAATARIELSKWIVRAGLGVSVLLGIMLLVSVHRRRLDLLRIRAQQEKVAEQQASLEKALGERDVLDRETHHRVKNNLQVVSSMLNLQAMRMKEGPLKEEFLRGKSRIDLMAMVHHRLYAMPDLREVDLQGFFDGLARDIAQRNTPRSHGISCKVDAQGITVATDPAIDMGIIFCELVNNSHQHAFPYSTGGHIDVHVERPEAGALRMVVKDNGVGFKRGRAPGEAYLGLEIVEALVQQWSGTFVQRTDGGAISEVSFRLPTTRA